MIKIKYNPPKENFYLNFNCEMGRNGMFFDIAENYFKDDNEKMNPEDNPREFFCYCMDLHRNHEEALTRGE